jgi:lysine-arginine-ornithine-binding protein
MTRSLISLAFIGCLLSLTPAAADENMPNPVRIGVEGAYPPFNFIDNSGTIKGFDIDIMNAICAEEKLHCEFVTQDWDGIIPALHAGKYDVIIGIGITEERKKVVDFTSKYWATPSRFIGSKDKSWTYTPEGLKDATIAVQSGAYQEAYVSAELPKSTMKVYRTLDQAYMDVEAGRVDLVFAAAIAHLNFLNSSEGKGYEFKGPDYDDSKYFGDGVGMAVRKGENVLRDTISRGIRKIRENGKYKKINDTYFPFDVYGK